MTPPRAGRRIAGCGALGLIVGVAAWVLGMDAPHAIGAGAVVAALAGVLALVGAQGEVSWAVPAPGPRPGARRDVVQLGWSIAARSRGLRAGHVSPDAVRRLRALATECLALRGVALDDPASAAEVARLLGDDALPILRRGSGESPSTAAYASLLARIEALAPVTDHGGG
ncbi:hypothetical protein IT072_11395 [Leifsonia sp. ZF2019]|uniref:hypothetical protein n=1 Tax=Leifsonia sp. ZF2019 TaxID=2781978 RepID=UPI001CBD5F98|nr:hypothetical protein [Leifsonia sp. ZF2019]UAJ77904.1 hypothetical protein IT072_11395 [Leifsonia sp. ZF2019]